MVKGNTTQKKQPAPRKRTGKRSRKAGRASTSKLKFQSPVAVMQSGPPGPGGRPRRIQYYRVDPPDLETEEQITYFQEAPLLIEKILKFKPCRASFSTYKQTGYPVKRGGPFVEMPYVDINKRPYTTVEAIKRWCTVVASIKRDL